MHRSSLAAACLALLVAGAACSGANNGYGAKNAPPAAAATQLAVVQGTTSPPITPAAGTPAPLPIATAPASPIASTAAATAAPAAATPATPLAVGIAGFAFAPATLHVPAGGSVAWTNNDAVTHTVTPDAGGIDAHELAPGAAFTQTFTSPGTYGYHCAIHPFMKGSIVVG
jgi:plastocyanin